MIDLCNSMEPGLGSNSRPLDLQSDMLPTALRSPGVKVIHSGRNKYLQRAAAIFNNWLNTQLSGGLVPVSLKIKEKLMNSSSLYDR